MSFLAPIWLAIASAAAVPIVLHLLRLRRGVRVDFPAIRFLLRAMREHRRELRLRNLALMLLRVAIVLVIALAAAKPLGRAGGSGHSATALALVLDNSMSTGAVRGSGSALETLKASALSVLESASPQDRVWVLTVDGQVSSGDLVAAREAVRRAQPIGGAGDLVGAIERGVSLASGSGMLASTVAVFTDGQATEWSRAARAGEMPVTIVAAAEPAPRNRAVREARATPVRWVPRGALEVSVLSPDSADVRVALGDRTLARTTLGPDGSMTVRGAADQRGWTSGRVELAPDELRGDDVRHFAVFAGEAPAVRVDQSAGQFARAAIETLAEAGRISIGGSITIAGAEQANRKPVLVFAPSDPVRVGAANRALSAAGIPWKFGDAVKDETSVRAGDLSGVLVHTRYALTGTAAGAADTIALAGGTPWIVAGDGFVIVGSPLDPSATNLPVTAQFLPWLESTVARYLLTDGGRVIAATPAQTVTLPLGVDELLDAEQHTIGVRGRTTSAPSRTGVYWMRRGGATVGALVVNAEPTESNLASLDADALKARVASPNARAIAPGEAVAHTVFSTSSRRPLVGMLLVLLAVLLVAEAFLARDPHTGGSSA